jgi:hypothetical protein
VIDRSGVPASLLAGLFLAAQEGGEQSAPKEKSTSLCGALFKGRKPEAVHTFVRIGTNAGIKSTISAPTT